MRLPRTSRPFDWLFRPQAADEDAPLSAEARFAEALAELPAVERSALALSEIGGLRTDEIADRLGTEPEIVRHLLLRARSTMRVKLKDRRNGLASLLPFQGWFSSGAGGPALRAAGAVAVAVLGTGIAVSTVPAADEASIQPAKRADAPHRKPLEHLSEGRSLTSAGPVGAPPLRAGRRAQLASASPVRTPEPTVKRRAAAPVTRAPGSLLSEPVDAAASASPAAPAAPPSSAAAAAAPALAPAPAPAPPRPRLSAVATTTTEQVLPVVPVQPSVAPLPPVEIPAVPSPPPVEVPPVVVPVLPVVPPVLP